MAVAAGLYRVPCGELIPVNLLLGREHACSVAQRTGTSQGRDDGCPDEFRTIGKVLDGIEEVLVHLEADDFMLFHDSLLAGTTKYYLCNSSVAPVFVKNIFAYRVFL